MRYCLILVALFTVGCGSDSPTAPTPPPPASVAGNWQGTWSSSSSTVGNQLVAIVMNLTQAGSAVSGTYATSTFNGTVSGTTTTTSFTGTFSFNGKSSTGAACTGSFSVSGGAGSSTLSWGSPGVTGNCNGLPVGIVLTMQR